ncbi:MAG: citrate transporter, partial [Proteobacteria bacterium]|nr:citrate transporter [Pseudomonadota bacterium]
ADVFHAYVAAAVALVAFGLIAARQQHAYQPIQRDASAGKHVDWTRLGIVAWILVAAIVTNIVINTQYPQVSDAFPFIGAAVWVAILLAVPRAASSCCHWWCAPP